MRQVDAAEVQVLVREAPVRGKFRAAEIPMAFGIPCDQLIDGGCHLETDAAAGAAGLLAILVA
jgi:hypothetical protein